MASLTKSSGSDIPHPDNPSLPVDILDHMIVPRLPFKTLKRFQCVSHWYRSLIGHDPLFPSEQARLLSPSSTDLVHLSRNGRLSFLINPESIGVPDPSLQFLGRQYLYLLSSTNGLLLFYGNFKDSKSKICVCNPATQEKVFVPAPPKKYVSWHNIGIAFDPSITPNLFIIVILDYDRMDMPAPRFVIFRSDTGEWSRSNKRVHVNSENFRTGIISGIDKKGVHVRGVIYWLFFEYILWYHAEKDLAGYVPLPTTQGSWCMGVYADGVVCCHVWDTGVEVWRLTNGTHWDRLHCISWDSIPLQINHKLDKGDYFLPYYFLPLAFDGQFIYLLDRQKLFSREEVVTEMGSYAEIEGYNICTQQLEKKGGIFIEKMKFGAQVYDYHNSMVPLPKILG